MPDKVEELQTRLLVAAHCGTSDHRGAEFTVLRGMFHWNTIKEDTRDFVSDCIHCMMAKTRLKIPRPVSETLHAEKPNEIIHFEFLYMGKGQDEYKHVLVIKDDLSSYIWLHQCFTRDGITAASHIAKWIQTFGATGLATKVLTLRIPSWNC